MQDENENMNINLLKNFRDGVEIRNREVTGKSYCGSDSFFTKGEKWYDTNFLDICYRPSDSTVDNAAGLVNLFEQACRDCNNCVILNFNLRELSWDIPESVSGGHPLINCMNDNFMHQLVIELSVIDNCTTTFSHATPILKSLHWLKVKERIVNKTVSLTYKFIITPVQTYMPQLIK